LPGAGGLEKWRPGVGGLAIAWGTDRSHKQGAAESEDLLLDCLVDRLSCLCRCE
jgi:hypothetical protein